MPVAGALEIEGCFVPNCGPSAHVSLIAIRGAVVSLTGGPETAGFMDKTVSSLQYLECARCPVMSYVLQDPYIKLTLHDGRFDEGGKHRGESVKTKTKDNAGGSATYNEKFRLNKPGLSRLIFCSARSVWFQFSA